MFACTHRRCVAASPVWFVVAVTASLLACTQAAVHSITDYGAVAGDPGSAANNTRAFNTALAAASSGDIVLVPVHSSPFYIYGGVSGSNLVNVTLAIQGNLSTVTDFDAWPHDDKQYAHIIHLVNCSTLTVNGGGTVDGNGLRWWNDFIIGKLKYERPKLLVIESSTHVTVKNMHARNSPSWHIVLDHCRHMEVTQVTVFVDRNQKQAAQRLGYLHRGNGRDFSAVSVDSVATSSPSSDHMFGDWSLQVEDLNTDGIDISGSDAWVHNCSITNDDDSIAVKPSAGDDPLSPCTENMLFEHLQLTGFGASIGSVPPNPAMHCVRNITFRSIDMPETGKGIYIKSNPSCLKGSNFTAIIEDILYEDITITKCRWYAVWIGPQQQHEPGSSLGRKCSLFYPISPNCPTQGCVTFRNITLRNVYIDSPWLSPGVILGNATNPMQNVVFDNVTVINPGRFPFGPAYQCQNADVKSINSNIAPNCTSTDP